MSLTVQQRKDLASVNQELAALSNKSGKWLKQDEIRFGQLKMQEKAVLAGMTIEELEIDGDNERRLRAGGARVGLLPIETNKNSRDAEFRGWKKFIKTPAEQRNMTEGNVLEQFGTYSGLGYYVPTGLLNEVFLAAKAHDALFDRELVTFIETPTGAPLPVPVASDVENTGSIVTEGTESTEVDIASTGHVSLGAWSFRSRRFIASLEAFEDMATGLTVVDLFKKFAADFFARTIGSYLINGTGSGQPTGLLTALATVGAPVVIAAGAAVNTGGSQTDANSLGSPDFANALAELNPAYLGPNTAWLMNFTTLVNLLALVDKYGEPLRLVQYVDGVPTIFNIPVRICPSMPNTTSASTPVILGDCSYWATRVVQNDNVGIQVYREAPGLIENGNIALRLFARADGNLLYTDTSAPCPFVMIQQHS
jgi:HK97 family phage major capsid protein